MEETTNFIHEIIDKDLETGRVDHVHTFPARTERLSPYRQRKGHLDKYSAAKNTAEIQFAL